MTEDVPETRDGQQRVVFRVSPPWSRSGLFQANRSSMTKAEARRPTGLAKVVDWCWNKRWWEGSDGVERGEAGEADVPVQLRLRKRRPSPADELTGS